MESSGYRPEYLAAILAAALLSPSAHAQQALEPVSTKTGWETWTDPPPVSGGLRVGIMTNDPGQLDDPEYVSVLLPDSEAPFLCVVIRSLDGRYSASLGYDIADTERGAITVHVPTDMKSRIDDYKYDQLVVLASLRDRCDGSIQTFVISEWQDLKVKADLSDDLAIYLNSQLPTTIGIGSGGSLSYEADCIKLRGETVAYNLSCVLPKEKLDSESDVNILISEGGLKKPYSLPLAEK